MVEIHEETIDTHDFVEKVEFEAGIKFIGSIYKGYYSTEYIIIHTKSVDTYRISKD